MVGSRGGSTDGTLFVIGSRSAPHPETRVWAVEHGEARLVSRAPFEKAALASGGKLLAIVTGRGLAERNRLRVDVLATNGSGQRTVVRAGCLAKQCPLDFAWSPDGSRLAVVLVAAGSARVRIYSAAGALLGDVTPPTVSGPALYERVDWSPDGRWIGVLQEVGTAGTRFCCKYDYLLLRPGGGVAKVLFDIADAIHDTPVVSWAPNGKHVALTTEGAAATAARNALITFDGSLAP